MPRHAPAGFEGINPAIAKHWENLHPQHQEAAPEYLTTRQIAAVWRVSLTVARDRVNRLVKDGQAVAGVRTIAGSTGIRRVPCYKLIMKES